MLNRSFGTSPIVKPAVRVLNAAVSALLKDRVTKTAGACDVAEIRKAALRADGSPKNCGQSSSDYSTPNYLGPSAAVQTMTTAADFTFTMTVLNTPMVITQLQISVASKGVISVKSIKIAGVEYLLNGEILADFFDPQAEESDCPINLPTCPLQINQSVVVVLHNYSGSSVLGGVMARGLS